MRLGILNGELGIAVIEGIEDLGHLQSEEIKKNIPEGATIESLAFFYMPDRDWIVLNKGHELYWFYSDAIPVFLELSEKSRKECVAQAPTDTVRKAWEILEEVIMRRQLIYLSRKVV